MIWTILICTHFILTMMAVIYIADREPVETRWQPTIDIIKPLKGMDPGLKENLESFFNLAYTNYQLAFCVEDENSPEAHLVRELIHFYPHKRATLLVKSWFTNIPNPKVRNIAAACSLSDANYVLISDSGARVGPFYLQEMITYLKPNVAIVTSLAVSDSPETFAGDVEQVGMATFYTRLRAVGFAVGRPTVMGLSMMYDREVINRTVGGIHAAGNYLAEDFVLGEKIKAAGFEIALVPIPVRQYLGHYSWKRFLSRHTRWTQLRYAHSPLEYLFEPLFYPVVTAFFVPGWWFLPLHFALYMLMDGILISNLSLKTRPTSVPAWFVREALAPLLWLYAFTTWKINWRGNKLKLRFGGRINHENHT